MALNSTSTISILDLLCEGPIGGVQGYKGLYLDETPVTNADGSNNFKTGHVLANFSIGSPNNTKPSFFNSLTGVGTSSGVSNIIEVNQEIGKNYSEQLNVNNEVISRDYGAGSITRQITDKQVNFVQLLFTVPKLYSVAQEGLAKGQLFGGRIRIRVYVQAKGSGTAFVEAYQRSIEGISTNNYQFLTGPINLKSYGSGPWNIKVQKINLDENFFEIKYTSFETTPQNTPLASSRGNQIIWSTITEYISQNVNYNYSALAEVKLSTESFANIPSRAYLIKGRLVQIPTGSSPTNQGYLVFDDSLFDGSLKGEHWTTCPVCCFYDLLTNKRYGAGQFIDANNLSWIDLYPISKYCNQLVINPDGTQEPRFACNVVIGDRADAYSVLQDMASIFRGILFWSNNVIQVAADHGNIDGSDLTVSHIYTNSNVVGGIFEYSGSSLKTRSTSIRVRYNDPDNFYKPNIVVVEDADLIAKYGYQVKETIAFGCTSKWQAQRVGLWTLLTESLDDEVVSFTTGLQGAVVMPGQIFAVADELKQGTRISGRIASATTTAIVADQSITLPSGGTPKLTVLLPNGTVETQNITSVAGSTINVSNAFSTAPNAQSIWSITTLGVANQKFRCISVAEAGNGTYSITGVVHNDSIYSAVDKGEKLEFLDITTLDDQPPSVSNISFSAGQINDGTGLKIQVNVSWAKGAGGSTFGYEVSYTTSGTNKTLIETTTNPNLTVTGVESGQVITVEVKALGLGYKKKSSIVTGQFTVPSFAEQATPTAPVVVLPEDPKNVTLELISGSQIILRWDKPLGIGSSALIAIIRHSSKTDGTGDWPNSTLLSDSISADTTYAVLPKIDGEYLVKFQSPDGLKSANATSAVLDQPDPIPLLSITTVREDTTTPPYQGQKENVFYSDEYDALVIDGDETLDGITDFDAIGAFDFTGTQLLAGRYYFNNIVDLGGKFTAKFKRTLTTRGLYPADLMDSKTELIDRWTDFDGVIPDETSAELYFRTSDVATVNAFFLLESGDDLLLETGDNFELQSDINFGPWIPMFNGEYAGRQFQFKVELSSSSTDETPLIDELGFELVMEARTEQSATIASGAGAKVVTYAKAFYQTPALGLTAFNLATGDYYEVTAASRTGFTVTFRNSAGTAIDRNFQYVASGYGTEQI